MWIKMQFDEIFSIYMLILFHTLIPEYKCLGEKATLNFAMVNQIVFCPLKTAILLMIATT
jgi:hypothetical protein